MWSVGQWFCQQRTFQIKLKLTWSHKLIYFDILEQFFFWKDLGTVEEGKKVGFKLNIDNKINATW